MQYPVPTEVLDLLTKYTISPSGCWLWTGTALSHGYAIVSRQQQHYRLHKVAYEQKFGRVPRGLVLDHLCRVRHCINPDHLEAVTDRVNLLRGVGPSAQNAKKTHCPYGHEYTPENTYIAPSKPTERDCRECIKRRERFHRKEKRQRYRTLRRDHYNAYQRRYRQQRKEQGRPIG